MDGDRTAPGKGRVPPAKAVPDTAEMKKLASDAMASIRRAEKALGSAPGAVLKTSKPVPAKIEADAEPIVAADDAPPKRPTFWLP